jgi:hypothetical protein
VVESLDDAMGRPSVTTVVRTQYRKSRIGVLN